MTVDKLLAVHVRSVPGVLQIGNELRRDGDGVHGTATSAGRRAIGHAGCRPCGLVLLHFLNLATRRAAWLSFFIPRMLIHNLVLGERGEVEEMHPDEALAAIATRQRGLVTSAQLARAGLGRGAIASRTARGSLRRVHHGVYLVGHEAAAPLTRELAAVLACGPRTALSHGRAAVLWELLPETAEIVDIDVTVPGCRANRPGIRVHRAQLAPADVRRRSGIPVTSVARTLLDLAPAIPSRELERALDEARVRRLLTRRELARLQSRPALRALLDDRRAPTLTRSEAEERMLALVRAAHLPAPEVNVRVGRHLVDFLWRPQRIVVEVDGFAFHSQRSRYERDRLRDAELTARGIAVTRVTWRQLQREPHAVVARLAQALAAVRPIV